MMIEIEGEYPRISNISFAKITEIPQTNITVDDLVIMNFTNKIFYKKSLYKLLQVEKHENDSTTLKKPTLTLKKIEHHQWNSTTYKKKKTRILSGQTQLVFKR